MSSPELYTPLCTYCKHAYPYEKWVKDDDGIPIATCPAFPNGTPLDVNYEISGDFFHFEKYPGQKTDIVYEPDDDDFDARELRKKKK